MIEIPDGLSDEEFTEFYWSKTDEERIQINRQLAYAARESGFLSEEEFAKRLKKIDDHAKLIEDMKRVKEVLARAERAKQVVEDRINARFADMAQTESPDFFDESKNKKSH